MVTMRCPVCRIVDKKPEVDSFGILCYSMHSLDPTEVSWCINSFRPNPTSLELFYILNNSQSDRLIVWPAGSANG